MTLSLTGVKLSISSSENKAFLLLPLPAHLKKYETKIGGIKPGIQTA